MNTEEAMRRYIEREKAKKSTCPIGLDEIHCQNCYFWRDGKCAYDEVMADKGGEL